MHMTHSADLVIRIPGDLSHQDGFYRLDYSPPVGFPAANTTFPPQAISDKMEFSRGCIETYGFKNCLILLRVKQHMQGDHELKFWLKNIHKFQSYSIAYVMVSSFTY